VTGKDQDPADAGKRRHRLRAPRKGDPHVAEILPRLLSPQRWVASGVLGSGDAWGRCQGPGCSSWAPEAGEVFAGVMPGSVSYALVDHAP